jgi:hypothetical protein
MRDDMSYICRAFCWENHTWPYRYACIRPFIAESCFIRHEEIMSPIFIPLSPLFLSLFLCLSFLFFSLGWTTTVDY